MKVVLLLLLSKVLSAQEINIGFTKAYNLVLRSNSCEKLIENRDALCSWKESLGEENLSSASQCKKSKNGVSKVIISSCLPNFTKKHHKRKLYGHGANCWGTALSFKKISKKPRFVWAKEMVYWLNSPICRKLDVGEEKKAGDILNIYGPEYKFEEDETTKGDIFWDALYPGRNMKSPVKKGYTGFHNFLHSETFITEDISFGKESPNKDDRFKFQPTNEVYGRSRNKNCQERQDMDPHFREYDKKPIKDLDYKECKYFSTAYRCENFMEFFSNKELTNEEKVILEDIKEIQKIQEDLFSIVTKYKKKMKSQKIKALLKIADQKSNEALERLSVQNVSRKKIEEMLLTLKYFSAQGIRKSLEMADLTTPTERL